MLQRLLIENVALIERAEVTFSPGVNVLSGETGAGKSVILDAIDFVLGAKADRSLIRSGESCCSVRAEFSCDERLCALLEEMDVESDDTLILTRRFSADGKSSLKINGCAVTAGMLRRVTSALVDVHGQSEHFFLLKEANQRKLLDDVAGETACVIKEELSALLLRRKQAEEERAKLGGNEAERERRLDILRFQIDEIAGADLKEGEEEQLLAFRERIRNAEKIVNSLGAIRQYLESDGGCADALRSAQRHVSHIERLDEKYAGLSERLESAAAEVEDLAETVRQFADELDVDEREAERVESRLDELKSLKKKYGATVADILQFGQTAQEEYELLSDSGARCEALEKELCALDDKIYEACLNLTQLRKHTAEGFTARVVKELGTLGIASAKFEVSLGEYTREDVSRATSEGLDGVTFLFSANAGEPLKELGKIISGGEMSRFMLAVKTQLSTVNAIGTYIFDEIDAGIGGKTARVVAEKFCEIGKNVQIIAVSHLAQIAAIADREFYIEKLEEKGRTFTVIHALDEGGRIAEITRLIGGDVESETARLHAKELLESASAYKKQLADKTCTA